MLTSFISPAIDCFPDDVYVEIFDSDYQELDKPNSDYIKKY